MTIRSFEFYQLYNVLSEYINLSPNWCHISAHDYDIDLCNVNYPILCWASYNLPLAKTSCNTITTFLHFHVGFSGQSIKYILMEAHAKHTFDTNFVESGNVVTSRENNWCYLLNMSNRCFDFAFTRSFRKSFLYSVHGDLSVRNQWYYSIWCNSLSHFPFITTIIYDI